MSFKEKLLELNKRGLIHAPDESEANYFQRCTQAAPSSASPASSLAKKIFDIDPDWIFTVYDNKGLHFWEGACTWTKRDHVTLQLNKAYQKKHNYFGYSKDEVIAHELVHVVRNTFEEPIFEEILAYQSSSSFLRKYCAPFFRTPKESSFFMLFLAGVAISTFFDTLQNIMFAGFVLLIGAGAARLFWNQWTFLRTKKKLKRLVGENYVLAMMLRLTDREIIRFSKMSEEQIKTYAKKMAKIQLRWQQIIGSYFI